MMHFSFLFLCVQKKNFEIFTLGDEFVEGTERFLPGNRELKKNTLYKTEEEKSNSQRLLHSELSRFFMSICV